MGATNSRLCPKHIANYIDSLRSRLNVEAVVLFGSRARGDHDPFSDWDLFVIAANLADWKQRQKDVWKDKPPGVDVVAWTPDEVRRHIYRTLILDVATEGVPLYGDVRWLRQLAKQHSTALKKTARINERSKEKTVS